MTTLPDQTAERDHAAALVADAILDARPALAAFRPGVEDVDALAELRARPLTLAELEALHAGVDAVRAILVAREVAEVRA